MSSSLPVPRSMPPKTKGRTWFRLRSTAQPTPAARTDRDRWHRMPVAWRYHDPTGLWNALLDGRDCVVDIPGSRWDPQKFFDPSGGRQAGATCRRRGCSLRPEGIQPRVLCDPAPRGGDPGSAAAPASAVRMGGVRGRRRAREPPRRSADRCLHRWFMMDHLANSADPRERARITTHSPTAGTLTMLSNRLSYVFDLRGPSISLDTACSSSLVAVHQACQSIWANESDAALAGGVNVLLSPGTQITMAKGRFLSRTGRCQAFSENADGYVRAEGAAVLLLKPLSAAERDGNTVHAIVLGTAANQDGRTNGITVPNGDAQIEAMRTAYQQAGVTPSEVTYVEAHGTGTPVGDPIEAGAIGTVVGAGRIDGSATSVRSKPMSDTWKPRRVRRASSRRRSASNTAWFPRTFI